MYMELQLVGFGVAYDHVQVAVSIDVCERHRVGGRSGARRVCGEGGAALEVAKAARRACTPVGTPGPGPRRPSVAVEQQLIEAPLAHEYIQIAIPIDVGEGDRTREKASGEVERTDGGSIFIANGIAGLTPYRCGEV